ncbi:unnamed protein product [Phytomonas sp. Hart1]|nr:unnamed protein product [Phytomonas sp. Hart1]|eukprot:CCW69291.1 unnamed protein product [Phytomonas sp. isolate Hart1]
MDTTVCVELLRTLLCPQDKYSESIHLSMDYIDLNWLKKNRQPPTNLRKIQDLNFQPHEDLKTRTPIPTLNSPRSVLVLLRNGLTINDLLPLKDTSEEALQVDCEFLRLLSPTRMGKMGPSTIREMVRTHRAGADQNRRAALFAFLLEDYRQLCEQVSLSGIVEAFRLPAPPRPLSASLDPHRERIGRIFSLRKSKMAKTLTLANLLKARKETSEARLRQIQSEAQAAMVSKALKEAQARQRQRERLEAHQNKKKQIEAIFQRAIEEKLARAAQRNRERQAAMARLFAQQHQRQEALNAERSQRFEGNAGVHLQLAEEVERKRLTKEAKLEFGKLLQAERLEVERYTQKLAQAKAMREREAVLGRVAEKQAATLEAARLRQQKVEAHLLEFRKKCEDERAARAVEEEERRKRQLQASAKAVELDESLRLRITEKLQQRDKAYYTQKRENLLKRVTVREQEREIESARSFAVIQNQRVKEFCKLHTIIDLTGKEKIAEQLKNQREEALEETRKINEMLNKERENLQQ